MKNKKQWQKPEISVVTRSKAEKPTSPARSGKEKYYPGAAPLEPARVQHYLGAAPLEPAKS